VADRIGSDQRRQEESLKRIEPLSSRKNVRLAKDFHLSVGTGHKVSM
jgi:hypothetical protein